MRPLKLTMRAFGPYATEEVIDFSKIGNEQIFVISGKTGAGKTTIFDAMSFALYGKANTNSRDGLSLRSHFAAEDVITEVELVFKIGNQLYQIIRSPQQEVQKKNSEDTRVVTAKAALYHFNNEAELIVSGVREVDEKIADIMQLDVNQFRQILMIPQNEFRELLVAPSKDKQLILQKLANTFLYKKLEDQLKEEQNSKLAEIQQTQKQIEQITTTLQGFFAEELATAEDTTIDLQTFVSTKIQEKELFLKNVEDELTVLVMRIENMTKDIAFAETKLQQWAQLETALVDKKSLHEQYDAMAGFRQKLELNKRTASLKLQEIQCKELEKQENDLQIDIAELGAKLEIARKELATIKEERSQFLEQQASQQALQKELANFDLYDKHIQQIEQSAKTLKTLQTQIANYEREQNALNQQISEFEIKKEQYQVQEKTLNEMKLAKKDLENEATVLEQKLKEMQTAVALIEQKDKLMVEKESVQSMSEQLDAKVATMQAELAHFEKQKQSQHAIILAEALEEGSPCPVCGSVHHPQPIQVADAFDEAQYLQQQQDLQHALTDQQKMHNEIAKLDGMLAQLTQLNTTDDRNLPAEKQRIEMRVKEILEQLQPMNKELLSENQNENNLAWTTKELNGFYRRKELLQEELGQLRAPAQGTQAQIEMLQKQIPSQYHDREFFYQQRANIQEQVEAYQAQAAAYEETYMAKKELVSQYETEYNLTMRNAQKVAEERKQQQIAFDKAILQADFKDYLTYSNAILSSDEEQALTQQVQEYEKAFYHNQQIVEQLQQQLDGQEKPNIEQLQATKVAYEQQRDQIIETRSTYNEQLRNVQQHFATYQALLQTLSTQEQHYRDLGELADTANGKNERNLGFERYVLGTFLDNILQHTNTRLSKMTNGRFTLLRKNEKAKYNAQSGLDLVVFDEYTGKNRDVTSLSGGESFKTSLALALALAEVVQEMSGGISLETMFIDEGFGTLDADSLDSAIESLLEVEQSGRLVGIISHVPELKERIPVKLEVIADNHGSHTQFIKS